MFSNKILGAGTQLKKLFIGDQASNLGLYLDRHYLDVADILLESEFNVLEGLKASFLSVEIGRNS